MKEFYERILVARYIKEEFKRIGKELSLNDCFYYVTDKGDSSSVDYVWLSIGGDYLTWENHLEDICLKILNVSRMQPGYCPFTVDDETMKFDNNYRNWYYNSWTPYINSLVRKYAKLWEPRLETKIGRGMVDIVSIIKSKIGESDDLDKYDHFDEEVENNSNSVISSSKIFS